MLKTRVIVAAFLIAALLALTLWLPPVSLAFAAALLAAVGAMELMRCVGTRGARRFFWPILAAAAIPLGFYYGEGETVSQISLIFLMLTLFAEAVFSYGQKDAAGFGYVGAGLFAGFIVPLCFVCLVLLRIEERGGLLIIMAFVITAVSDTGGYFGGRWFGRHKGVVKASPNKSLEGFIGSFLSGLVGILLFGVIMDKLAGISVKYGALLLMAVFGNVTTQLGDLAFSVIKREHGVKDYGKLFPGHGGVLDRFDSMIFTAPLVWLVVRLAGNVLG